ncbi:MAG: hypothetical protein JSW60_01160 [Thermoplasmatales archaeon]|nr:MAG: hypothetical protein JSW60_01160 [Thermoplasmatales archaeon]
MAKKMPIGLQRYVIEKIARRRGNLGHPDAGGLEQGIVDVALDNLDPDLTFKENMQMLESEGILLPVLKEEMAEYVEKQTLDRVIQEQEELEREEKQDLYRRLDKFYGIDRRRILKKQIEEFKRREKFKRRNRN